MKFLKPIQNTRKKRFTFTQYNGFMWPKIWMHNVAAVSFKTLMFDIPFIGTLELVLQK